VVVVVVIVIVDVTMSVYVKNGFWQRFWCSGRCYNGCSCFYSHVFIAMIAVVHIAKMAIYRLISILL